MLAGVACVGAGGIFLVECRVDEALAFCRISTCTQDARMCSAEWRATQGCSLTGLISRLLTGLLRLRVPLAPVAGLGVMSSHRRVPRVNEWPRVVAASCMRPLSLDNSFPV